MSRGGKDREVPKMPVVDTQRLLLASGRYPEDASFKELTRTERADTFGGMFLVILLEGINRQGQSEASESETRALNDLRTFFTDLAPDVDARNKDKGKVATYQELCSKVREMQNSADNKNRKVGGSGDGLRQAAERFANLRDDMVDGLALAMQYLVNTQNSQYRVLTEMIQSGNYEAIESALGGGVVTGLAEVAADSVVTSAKGLEVMRILNQPTVLRMTDKRLVKSEDFVVAAGLVRDMYTSGDRAQVDEAPMVEQYMYWAYDGRRDVSGGRAEQSVVSDNVGGSLSAYEQERVLEAKEKIRLVEDGRTDW